MKKKMLNTKMDCSGVPLCGVLTVHHTDQLVQLFAHVSCKHGLVKPDCD